MVGHGLQIIGIMVHVVSTGSLSRPTMSAAICCDDAIAFTEEKKHLRVPIICGQWPTVAEHNRLPGAPVFIIDLNVLSVFCSSTYEWHDDFLSVEITGEIATRGRIGPSPILVLPRRLSMLRLRDFSNIACANQHSAN